MKKTDRYSLKELRKDFPDEDACLAFVFDATHSRECSCGGSYRPVSGRRKFQCSKCRYQIAPCAGTSFHKSDTPLSVWFHALFVFSCARSGLSAKELERQIGTTYKTAYRILRTFRQALAQDGPPLSGTVETDTGFFGGFRSPKAVVQAARQRGGRMRAGVIERASAFDMFQFLRGAVRKGSSLMTDGAKAHLQFQGDYAVRSVRHKGDGFVLGDVHVNGVESFFSHVKRSIRGTFKAVSAKRLQEYLDSFVFHYDNRHSDRKRFEILCRRILGA